MSFWQRFRRFIQADEIEDPPASAETRIEKSSATGEHPVPSAEGDEAEDGVLELEICLQSDPGKVRTNNEDRGLYKRPSDPEITANKGTLIVVADGMGGASAGEIASEMAVRRVPEIYYTSEQTPALALKEALEQASREIHQTAQGEPGLAGMGTTCVAVAVRPPEVFMAYVGDSRLYLLRGDNFYQLSEDHSVVYEMVRKGLLTREQARHHEERNVLSMSMGGRPEVTASYWERPMLARPGDRFLICSDGLHDLVSDAEMQSLIGDNPADVAVHKLIAAANDKGGQDNITAALVHVHTRKIQYETDSRATREVLISSP